jgi:hypothetical protein
MPSLSKVNDDSQLVVSPKKGAAALDVGLTRVYELINSGQLQSYHDGKSRKIVVASLEAYIARQIEAEATKEQRGWTDRATSVRMAKKLAKAQIRRDPPNAGGAGIARSQCAADDSCGSYRAPADGQQNL